MSGQLRLALIALLCTTIPLFAVTIDGTATLQGETNHSGIRVLFTGASPSAVTDSTFTDGSGYFSLDLAIGIYDLSITKLNFINFDRTDREIIADATMPDLILADEALALHDTLLSASYGVDLYFISGDIVVPAGEIVTFEQGSEINFLGPSSIMVYGQLNIAGTEEMPVIVTSQDSSQGFRGRGIRYIETESPSVIEHCIYEYGFSGTGNETSYDDGGAILAENSSLEISNSEFRYNRSNGYGGAISIQESGSLSFVDCWFHHNYGTYGGAISGNSGTSAEFTRCVFEDQIGGAGGGVKWDRGDTLTFIECVFANNVAMDGAAVMIHLTEALFEDCQFNLNRGQVCSALQVQNSSSIIQNCNFVGNVATFQGDAPTLYLEYSSATVNNCQFAFNSGYDIGFNPNAESQDNITFCNFWGVSIDIVRNQAQAPALLARILTVNQNGDSSDVYYNISQDPMFVNMVEGDFHLLENSRCIDAGDTTLTDPDGTFSDIGAYYYPQPTSITPVLSIPVSHELLSNYPNPFNPSTNISFVVERAGPVNVSVYDMLGRTVAELTNETMQAGVYTAHWNATSTTGQTLPSGSYWVRLNTPNQTAMHRIVLLR